MAKTLNILLTCIGRRVALLEAFRKALAEVGIKGRVLAADHSPLAAAFHLADDRVLVPSVGGPTYVDTLVDICRERQIDLVVPLIDWELPALSQAHARFAAEIGRAHV